MFTTPQKVYSKSFSAFTPGCLNLLHLLNILSLVSAEALCLMLCKLEIDVLLFNGIVVIIWRQ